MLAHISDLHLDGSERATARAVRVMDYLRGLPQAVDALVVTGDIADHGADAEYEEAARILTAPFPVMTLPGNHDERPAFRRSLLGEAAGSGPINSAHQVGETTILMCDSTIPGRDDGLLDEETIGWIEERLKERPAQPALLAFHQLPVAIHHPLPDSYPLQQPERLAELIAAHPQIVAVLTGHAHTAAATTFAGRPLLVGPAITWTLRLPWEGDQPADRDQPPALAFHILDDTGRLTTHYRVVL